MVLVNNRFHFYFILKNIENRVAWFLAELCKAGKGVQKDKRNQLRTELVRGCLAPRQFQDLQELLVTPIPFHGWLADVHMIGVKSHNGASQFGN
jgi:hypothetical protein